MYYTHPRKVTHNFWQLIVLDNHTLINSLTHCTHTAVQFVVHCVSTYSFTQSPSSIYSIVHSLTCPPIHSLLGATPLHLAALNGRLEATRILLHRGADPNIAARSGDTPLHLGSLNGHADVVSLTQPQLSIDKHHFCTFNCMSVDKSHVLVYTVEVCIYNVYNTWICVLYIILCVYVTLHWEVMDSWKHLWQ